MSRIKIQKVAQKSYPETVQNAKYQFLSKVETTGKTASNNLHFRHFAQTCGFAIDCRIFLCYTLITI
jgi:hypothetical protein